MRDPKSILEDRPLVAAYLRKRDEHSFRVLYRRHTPVLYGVVSRFLRDPADVEDAIQETWIAAARRLAGFRWETALGTWLVAIAINCARNRLRRQRADEAGDYGEVTELPVTSPIEHAIDPIDMERAIDALPDGYRQVLVLHDVHGYKHDEVADMLGIATGTSKSQLTRARSSLRRWLGRLGENNDAKRSQ